MAHVQRSVVELLNRIRYSIYDRLQRADIRYQGDLTTLQKHLHLAREMENDQLIGMTLNVMGMLEQTVGRFQQAIILYQQAHEVFERLASPHYVSLMKNNIGEVYRLSGNYQQALSYYISARYQVTASNLSPAEIDQVIPIIDSNIGQVLVALGELDEAEEHFLDVLSVIGNDAWRHVQVVSEAWRGLAEIYLQRGELEKAKRHINYARDIAEGRRNKLMIAESALTCAHIATQNGVLKHPPEHYYDECHNLLQGDEAIGIYARILLNEARYQHQHGNLKRAHHFAQQAYQRFEKNAMAEEAQMAAKFMKTRV